MKDPTTLDLNCLDFWIYYVSSKDLLSLIILITDYLGFTFDIRTR